MLIAASLAFLIKIVLVIGSFGFLILVHELGHFFVARWSGVRILRFSIGFGRTLVSWKGAETEYRVAMIPLGGYVKMAGEEHAERSPQPGEYLSKPIGVRAGVILAGPLVNYLTAVVIMWLVFCIGFPEYVPKLAPIIGMVRSETPAAAAGVQVGDLVLSVNGHAIRSWDEVVAPIEASPEQPVKLRLQRAEQVRELIVVPRSVEVAKGGGARRRIGAIGVEASEQLSPIIGEVRPGMPAAAAGLRVGDLVLEINGQRIRTWDEVTKLIQASPDQPITLAIDRAGARQEVTVHPKAEEMKGPLGTPQRVGRIGVGPSGRLVVRRVGPVRAIRESLRQTGEWTVLTLQGLASMLERKVPWEKSVSGPIGIGMLTWDAVTHLLTQIFSRIPTEGVRALASDDVAIALVQLLVLISLVSLGLAIFNVFPIPILDGGHLFFLAIEKLKGSPVSTVIQERAQQVSFVLLMTLVALICVNDVRQFGIAAKVLEWVRK
ncbi:MAG: RIP metalloprotease RseP [Candidatus Omnitrophica bacterium]|nr:RIP metalloprotease RseP [Candidatus Omnitrophota bacterium]